jgi:Holliday junction resolvase-like predicted endonuclease
MTGAPQRSDVVEMLAALGERQADQVTETISSLELTWLLHQIEQRYGELDIDDDTIVRMTTITSVVDVLRSLGVGAPDC